MRATFGVCAVGAALLAPLTLGACSQFDPRGGAPRTDIADEVLDADTREEAPPDGALSDGAVSDSSAALPGEVAFGRDIRPLMNRPPKGDPTGTGCKNCHYATEANHIGIDLGGLNMATLGALREGGGSSGRRIIVPGKPSESAIVQKLKGQYPYGARMPKNGPPFWTDAEIKLVSDWIAQGAKGADDE